MYGFFGAGLLPENVIIFDGPRSEKRAIVEALMAQPDVQANLVQAADMSSSGLAVTTQGFAQIGQQIAALNLPTLIVQEGGYLCPELGQNLSAVLNAFL